MGTRTDCPSIRGFGARHGLLLALVSGMPWIGPGGLEAAATGAYCATVLSPAELEAISPGAEVMSSIELADGHSECSWSVKGGGESNTLSLTLWEPRSMSEALVSADSPEEFFEMYVKSAEDVRGTKREALKGVGKRSALFRNGGVRELYLLSKAGVAHLVTDALTDAQLEGVAKAVAAP